ncbi:MAG: DUF222 domain-containing protein [Mycobacteriales bacterium]
MTVAVTDVSALTDGELESALTEWAGHLAAGEATFVDLVGEFDAREAWGGVGVLSCAHWLAWRCSLGANAARERVRVARALRSLPAIRAEFRAGRLSYSQVRALSRVATADTEGKLVDCARHSTATQLERLVAGMRRALRAEETETAARSYAAKTFSYHYADDGTLVFSGRLPGVEGALLVAAVEAAYDELSADSPPADPHDVSAETSPPARRADALLLLASTSLATAAVEQGDGDRYRVLVHVNAATLADDGAGERCDIEGGPPLAPETVRRLLCDSRVLAVTDLPDGTQLDAGRTQRFPSRALRRAVKTRDRCCQFPGCTRTKRLIVHHIEPWHRGGPTDLVNLVQLCSYHHHLVHEGGYSLARDPRGAIEVRVPAGWLLPAAPPLAESTPARLASSNEAAGADVSAETLPPHWAGDSLDLNYAVGVLLAG